MIFLAIHTPSGEEVHIKWKEHKKIEDAEKEMTNIRSIMMKQDRVPYDYYLYEDEKPPYGLKAYELDEVDMNFYEEKADMPVQKPRTMKDFSNDLKDALKEVAVLAKDEEEKFGKIQI